MPGVNSYKDSVVSRLYKGLQGLVKARGITFVEGEGRLVAPNAVEVDGTRYEGRHVVLATGSYAKSLPGLEIDGERVITSYEALTLDRVPGSVVVLGGGVIGVEFASVWRSFGAEVTIIEALPRLVPAEDEACSKAVERAFRKRGIAFRTEHAVQVRRPHRRRRQGHSREAATRSRPICCSSPSGAARSPTGSGSTRWASPWTAASSRPTSGCARTSTGVYAIGDLVPGLQLAHRGFAQGIFLAEEIAGLNPVPIEDDGIPRVTYCDPEVASVGLTEAQARERLGDGQGRDAAVQPRRQRQEPDPQDAGIRQAGPREGRPRPRRPHGRLPGSASWWPRRSSSTTGRPCRLRSRN